MKKTLQLASTGRYRIIKSGLLIISLVLTANATIFNGAGFTIVDGGGMTAASCNTVTVSGVTANSLVRSISINGVTHTWLGDTQLRVYRPFDAPPPAVAGVVVSSPPDGRSCNYAGTYRFIDTAAQSVDAATTGCITTDDVAPGDYRSSLYGGGSADGPVTSLATSFGTLTPGLANGTWFVCVYDFGVPTNGGSVGSTSIELISPSAAAVSLGGRVMTVEGRGIGNVVVVMSSPDGSSRTAITNPFGFYRFDGVAIGVNYLIGASSKSYTFTQQTISHQAVDDADWLNFIAEP
jgi:hypothetical protein